LWPNFGEFFAFVNGANGVHRTEREAVLAILMSIIRAWRPCAEHDRFLDLPMDFPNDTAGGQPKNPISAAGATIGSGAIIVLAEGRSIVEGALNFTRFFRNESCGKCVPCRMGSQKMVEILSRWTQGGISESQFAADLKLVDDLSAAMSQTSICGLGQIVPAPVQSVLKHFRPEVEAHVITGQCPSGICFSAANRLAELPRVGIRP